MRKKLLITGAIIIVIATVTYILWQVYDFSADYNYAAAKMDIASGDVKIINTGIHKISSKDKEIELVAARYGFRNIYVEKFTAKQTEKGIRNYNGLVSGYLIMRNGADWKTRYQREVDSLYKTTETGRK